MVIFGMEPMIFEGKISKIANGVYWWSWLFVSHSGRLSGICRVSRSYIHQHPQGQRIAAASV